MEIEKASKDTLEQDLFSTSKYCWVRRYAYLHGSVFEFANQMTKANIKRREVKRWVWGEDNNSTGADNDQGNNVKW